MIGFAGPKTLEDMDISFVQSQLQTAEHKVEHLTEVSFRIATLENCQIIVFKCSVSIDKVQKHYKIFSSKLYLVVKHLRHVIVK